jgi:hypothetical protein
MPMITTTISSSMSVKPLLFLRILTVQLLRSVALSFSGGSGFRSQAPAV